MLSPLPLSPLPQDPTDSIDPTEPSKLMVDSTLLQKIASVLALLFATAAVIMTAIWAHGHNTAQDFLGGLGMNRNIFNWHPVMMVTGAIFCLITAILSYRLLPLPQRMQKAVHGIMHTAAIITISLGLVFVLISTNVKNKNPYNTYSANFTTIHTYMGLGVLILYGINYILGIVHFTLPGISLSFRQAYISSHVFLGTFLLVGALAAVLSGLMIVTSSCDYNVTSADTNPAQNYHLLSNGCRLANGIGVVVIAAVFLCLYATFRSNSTRVVYPIQ